MKKDLTQLEQNQKGKIIEILGGNTVVKKLDSLGIRVNLEIIKLSAISKKGPVIIQAGNAQIALGYNIAKKIILETN
ncbi:MAG: ferrous iron transport protein A [Endomicrobia bacterium]|nr:ferrous iron transport protein A [Endomicrobiia bacterium]